MYGVGVVRLKCLKVIEEYPQFLLVPQGSLKERETHLIIAEQLSYGTRAQTEMILSDTAEIGRLLTILIRTLKVSTP
jgi:four helix bundle protein